MPLSRRGFLSLVGGGAVLATGAGAHIARPAAAAAAPWAAAGGYADPRMRALSWAILAPNPHNRQPWVIDLRKAGRATLLVDTTRLLPHTDPFSRQIVIRLGCFLEVLTLAAEADGQLVTTRLFPDGIATERLDARPVAVIDFAEAAPGAAGHADPLFAQVFQRRTLKEPYDLSRPVEPEALAALKAAVRRGSDVGAINDPVEVEALRRLTHDALVIEVETPRTYKESVDLFRIGRAEINANPDGIDFGGPLFESLNLVGLMSREAALDTSSTIYRQGLAAVLANADTAMAHLWLTTPGNSREEQIMAGRDWVRVNLAATAVGLGIQPLSQALQEYQEMAPLYAAVHDRLAPEGRTVQMLARLGYGKATGPSPRWPLEAKVMHDN